MLTAVGYNFSLCDAVPRRQRLGPYGIEGIDHVMKGLFDEFRFRHLLGRNLLS